MMSSFQISHITSRLLKVVSGIVVTIGHTKPYLASLQNESLLPCPLLTDEGAISNRRYKMLPVTNAPIENSTLLFRGQYFHINGAISRYH